MFTFSKSALLGMVVTAAAAFSASNANAAVYSDLNGSNFKISNISDNNGAYGQPTIVDDKLNFTNTNFGYVGSYPNATGTSYRLTFLVTLNEGTAAPNVTLGETGIYGFLGNGGQFGVLPYLGLFNDPLSTPPTLIGEGFDAVTGDSSTDPAQGSWNSSINVSDSTKVSSYWVVIDNDFLTLANQGGLVLLDKKVVVICIGECDGGGDVPEPASLGVLGLGAMALLARRRK